jgi:ribonucleoside-diphosphate reductase alpha subunit
MASQNAASLNAANQNTASLNAASQNTASLNAASQNAASLNAASQNAASLNAASQNAASLNAASQNADDDLYVINRTGNPELLDYNQITNRIHDMINKPYKISKINVHNIVQLVIQGIKPGIKTHEIDDLICKECANLSLSNPDYLIIAGRLAVNNHKKNTINSFHDKMKLAYIHKDSKGKFSPIISKEFFKYVEQHQEFIESIIDYNRDYLIDYFGLKTFKQSYSLKINGECIERPQDLFMRTAISLHMNTVTSEHDLIKQTYDALSNKFYTHASPTYFNAGTNHTQYSSCFLLGSHDSQEGILETECAMGRISKWGGGLGVHIHCWRSKGAPIRGTNGLSGGIVPFLRIYNNAMRAWNQGGKRKGSAAIYLMPHHPDIVDFLKLKSPTGHEEERAEDLFYALWIPDLFMERVKDNEIWSLFDPDQTMDLSKFYGDEYKKNYLMLEEKKLYTRQIKARDLWEKIYIANTEKGIPYLCSSDNVNRANMQNNIDIIQCSNLCTEITLVSNDKETAVCNLSSISLPAFVERAHAQNALAKRERSQANTAANTQANTAANTQAKSQANTATNTAANTQAKLQARTAADTAANTQAKLQANTAANMQNIQLNEFTQANTASDTQANTAADAATAPGEHAQNALANVFTFNFKKLREIVKLIVINLNMIIDKNFYPTENAKLSNMRHRPIGIGIQGLADVFAQMGYDFDSPEASKLNKYIMETIYYAALSQSSTLCKEKIINEAGELVPVGPYPSMRENGGSHISHGIFHWELCGLNPEDLSGMYDWETLREHIKKFGVRNSHLVALMPTATTSQFLGNNECFEPYTANIYKRKTLSGEFIVINKWLINDLRKYGIWNEEIKNIIIASEGSVQYIDSLPIEIKNRYKTASEINQSVLIKLAIDRQPFVDQAQSLNWYVKKLNYKEFTDLSFQAWRGGLKTLKYYVHTAPAVTAQKFTIPYELQKKMINIQTPKAKFQEIEKDQCDLCGS